MRAVELENITKRFGDVVANDGVSLSVEQGAVHCILGENGAGKSTLMKVLFGLLAPESGAIRVWEQPARIARPTDAIRLGLGMVHQHFMLVPRLTVGENIVAGAEVTRRGFLDMRAASAHIVELAERYGLHANPDARVEDISVGEQQRVEILKALYREARILILDEPTAVLTPQETDELFEIIRELTADGKTVILITHKLRETMAISDRVTVLRDGKTVGTLDTAATSPPELARAMVGRDVILSVDRPPREAGDVVLEVAGLSVQGSTAVSGVRDVSFTVRAGEIVGVAGVEGNGQFELEEGLFGLREVSSGSIRVGGREVGDGTRGRRRSGVAYIPSDRQRRGLVAAFNLAWNAILGQQHERPFARYGVLQEGTVRAHGDRLLQQYQVRAPGLDTPLGDLSGGNQQKLVVAREIARDPACILACQPTRGLDVGAIEYIHNRLLEMREQGRAVLLISAELDEIRALADRILVMYEGRIVAEVEGGADEHQLGMLMAGDVAVSEDQRE